MTQPNALATDPGAPADAALPPWLPWAFIGLLAIPFHPDWLDAEQARRGLLLLLSGAVLLLRPNLRPVVGERAVWAFLGTLAVAGAVNWAWQALFLPADRMPSFQPMEAVYRCAHWLALLVVLRLGTAAPQAFGGPIAWAVAITSAFGVLQRLGWAELQGYGVAAEPVSTLGNLNVASEWTAIAAAAVASQLRPTRLATTALALAGAYLAVNGSRSGLVALPMALALLAVLRRRERGWLPLVVVVVGMLLGALLDRAVATGRPTTATTGTTATAAAARDPSTETLQVRWEIARGATRLFAESPVFGQGAGQFAVQYPRVRSQREIELSSLDRSFATEVRTAHDDWLEILVETGLLGFSVFAAALFALQRGVRDKVRLLPLFALLLLMLVRAPLLNAPAAAVALLLAAAPASTAAPTRRTGQLALGAGLLALGVPVLAAQFLFVPVMRAAAEGRAQPLGAAQAAAAVQPWEPRWRQIEAQLRLWSGALPEARVAAAKAVALRPFDPHLNLLLGEVLARGTAYGEAARMAKQGIASDPGHPELRVLLATTQLAAGDAERAVRTLVDAPHPTLRNSLARRFAELAEFAAVRGNTAGEARLRLEQHVLEALPDLGRTDAAALDATAARVRTVLASARRAERSKTDLRPYVVAALHALDVGDTEQAATLGEVASRLGVPLLDWQRALLGDHLERLRAVPSWTALVR